MPDLPLTRMTAAGPVAEGRAALFGGQTVAVFAVPGAFSPTCTDDHMPSVLRSADAIRQAGVDRIACLSVNDIFVMRAWAKALGVGDTVDMLADGTGAWTRAAGMDWDLSVFGLGVRSQRYAMIVDDAVIRHIAVEQGAAFRVSSGAALLDVLTGR